MKFKRIAAGILAAAMTLSSLVNSAFADSLTRVSETVFPVEESIQGSSDYSEDTGLISVHYYRPNGDYDGWDLWYWNDYGLSSSAKFNTDTDDDFVITTFEVPRICDYGFIIRFGGSDWINKDTLEDRFIPAEWFFDGFADIWIVSGDETVYTQRPDINSTPEPEPVTGKFNAYLSFIDTNYCFRNRHSDRNFGENSKYFHDGIVVWGGDRYEDYPELESYYDYSLEGYFLPAKITDAVIDKSGTYTVKIEEDVFTWEIDEANSFNSIILDTDIPQTIGAKIINPKLIVDGKTVVEYQGEPLTESEAQEQDVTPQVLYEFSEEGEVSLAFANIWNNVLDSYNGDYPTESLAIEFTVEIPGYVEAPEYEYTELNDGTLEISKCVGTPIKIEIPSEIDGKTVTSIGSDVFSNCTTLKSVVIPDSITNIGSRAFFGCTSLKSVTLSKSVTSIGEYAFGLFDDESTGSEMNKIPDFKIYCYKDSAGEEYAINYDLEYELIKEAVEKTITINYYRPLGDYADWDICCWYNFYSSSNTVEFTVSDDIFAKATFKAAVFEDSDIEFTIRFSGEEWSLDDSGIRYIPMEYFVDDKVEIWVITGDYNIYTERPDVANMSINAVYPYNISVNYYRFDDDYSDWDICFHNENGFKAAKGFETNIYGDFATTRIQVPCVGDYSFTLRRGGDSYLETDTDVERFVTADMFDYGTAEIWLVSDDETVYTEEPYVPQRYEMGLYIQNGNDTLDRFYDDFIQFTNPLEYCNIGSFIYENIDEKLSMSAEKGIYPKIGIRIINHVAEFEHGSAYYKGSVSAEIEVNGMYYDIYVNFDKWSDTHSENGVYYNRLDVDLSDALAEKAGFESADCKEFYEFIKNGLAFVSVDVSMQNMSVKKNDPVANSHIYIKKGSSQDNCVSFGQIDYYTMDGVIDTANIDCSIPKEAYGIMTVPTDASGNYPDIGISFGSYLLTALGEKGNISGTLLDIAFTAGGKEYTIPNIDFAEDMYIQMSEWDKAVVEGNSFDISLNDYIAKAAGIKTAKSKEFVDFIKTISRLKVKVELIRVSECEKIGDTKLEVSGYSEEGSYEFAGCINYISDLERVGSLNIIFDSERMKKLTTPEFEDCYPKISVNLSYYNKDNIYTYFIYKGKLTNIKVIAGGKTYKIKDIPFDVGLYSMKGNIYIQEQIAKALGFESATCPEFFEFFKTITEISLDISFDEYIAESRTHYASCAMVIDYTKLNNTGLFTVVDDERYEIYRNGETINNNINLSFDIPVEEINEIDPDNSLWPENIYLAFYSTWKDVSGIVIEGNLQNISFKSKGKTYTIPNIPFSRAIGFCSWIMSERPYNYNTSIYLNEYIAKAAGFKNADSMEFIEFAKTIENISLSVRISYVEKIHLNDLSFGDCDHAFYEEWKTELRPTCSEDGLRTRTCGYCWHREEQVIPATGKHIYSEEWTVDAEPTCTEAGSKSHHCAICDAKGDITEIPAKGHKFVDKVVEPTYTAKGYTLHTCSVCGYSYKDKETNKLVLAKIAEFRVTAKTDTTISLKWLKNEYATGYILEQYKDNKWVRIAKITKNTTTTYKVSGLAASSRNVFRIQAYKEIGKGAVKSDYTSKLVAYTNPKAMSGFKASSKSDSVINLAWAKNTSATGYILEQYKGNKWVRIAKITSNATTSYKVTGLSASTRYAFRIQAYKEFGSGAVKSAYTDKLVVYTNPKAMTGFKASAKTKNTITLSWTKNTSATGYILEQYKGNKWVRIAKITKNSTVSYKVTGLTANTRYAFRIQAYKECGSGAVKSAYTNKLVVYTSK